MSRARWRYEDLPAHLKAQVDGKQRQVKQVKARQKPVASRAPRKPNEPNKTEEKYRQMHLRNVDARYEILTFKLQCGARYTPDWVVLENGIPVECHEVKGSYRFASHGRAQLAFAQARIEFPGIKWVWATQKKGMFEIT
jgi:hypothetical protein